MSSSPRPRVSARERFSVRTSLKTQLSRLLRESLHLWPRQERFQIRPPYREKKQYSQLIYLNLTDLNQEEFLNVFNTTYHYKKQLTSYYPAFVFFEDGKVKSILQGTEKNPLTITKVKQFLELNEIGE